MLKPTQMKNIKLIITFLLLSCSIYAQNSNSKFVSIAIEDVITTLTIENRNKLISELEKKHKNNEFVSFETSIEGSPITIIFETIKGVEKYTGTQTTLYKGKQKRTNYFTTLTTKQLKTLKKTFSSGWKDD
jgi:hypothetical protein